MNEKKLGKGAIVTPTISKMPTLPRAVTPFDWSKGFFTRELVTKDQDGSGSCGGQAVAYKAESDTGVPKSARFVYAQVRQPSGGSSERDLLKILATEGICDEAVLTSYNGGFPPSESFMQTTTDITPDVLANAHPMEGVPEYVDLSFEGIAEAVRDHGGCIIGVYGENNGTWTSIYPKPPRGAMNTWWAHWLMVCGAGMYNGKRAVQVKNSWGQVGDNGKQWLTEEYTPYFFSAWTFVKGEYKFNNNLWFGMANEDVFALQARLGITPTGYFGPKTLSNVISYQKANKIPATGFVGILTRGKLNAS